MNIIEGNIILSHYRQVFRGEERNTDPVHMCFGHTGLSPAVPSFFFAPF